TARRMNSALRQAPRAVAIPVARILFTPLPGSLAHEEGEQPPMPNLTAIATRGIALRAVRARGRLSPFLLVRQEFAAWKRSITVCHVRKERNGCVMRGRSSLL